MSLNASVGRSRPLGFVFAGVAITALGGTNVAQEPSPDAITPAHVFVLVGTLRTELEDLRFLMGRPQNMQPEINVKGAAPREVYFQALTLFRKADRFCFEHTRERAIPPNFPHSDITPANVHRVVETALKCVQRVKKKYRRQTTSAPSTRDDTKQPTDVFKSIVQANRQLNLMLEREFAASDVFQQVTRCVGYASRLLEQFPDATRMPDEPPYQVGKRPAEVYRRLLKCVDQLRTIAKLSGLEMLELDIDEIQIQQAAPSDVYDVASLIVAELTYLHGRLPDAKPPREVYYVGRKFPAHVYQRAGILDQQLVELVRWLQENPHWLEREPRSR